MSPAAPAKSSNIEALRFIALFGTLVIGLTLLVQYPWINQHLILPYTESIAWLNHGMLRLFDPGVTVSSTIIQSGQLAVDIRKGCDGVVATLILISACLAYPLSWHQRFWGTVWGYLLIQILNLIRIVGLFLLIQRGSHQISDFFHTYVSQFIVIAAAMVFWIYWVGRQKTVAG